MLSQFVRATVFSSYLLAYLSVIVSFAACHNNTPPPPGFTNNKPIHVAVGKSKNAKVNVSNWNTGSQLVLVPGGPYLETFYTLQQPALFISKTNRYVFAVDSNNRLSVIDFSKQPAILVIQHELKDQVTALATYNQYLIIGYKHQGTKIFDVSDVSKMLPAAVFQHKDYATRIKTYDNHIYVLLSNQKLLTLEALKPSTGDNQWRQVATIILPQITKDFAINDTHVFIVGPEFGFGCLPLSQPEELTCTLNLQGKPTVVNVLGNTVFVASGTGGLTVFDISTPDQPRWLGSHNKFDTVDDVHISGDRAYVLDRGLRIASLNIANKNLPITGSFYKPAKKITGMLVEADYVFLATGNRIEAIHVPDQVHAQISNEGINQGGTRRAYIDNNIAYVADWFSGLHLYDISDPTRPVHLSNYHTPGSSKGVVVDKGIAYVGDDDHGLQIIDVSNPEQPTKISEVLTTGLAYTLKKRGNLIYLADHRGGFHIIDVSNVREPVIISSHDTEGKSWAIDVSDTVAYVADDTSGLLVFDVSDPQHPQQIGQFNPHGAAEDVVIKDKVAYVSFFDQGFYILDVRTPSHPKVISHLPVPGNARSVDLEGNYAYIAGWESGLNIIDISNPEAPFIAGSYDTKGSAWGADISQGHAFVWDWWGGVKVINIENPRQPYLVGKYHTRGEIIRLRQKYNYIYTASDSGGVQVFDIKNPLNPIWATGIDFPGKTVDVWLSDHSPFAYAANSTQGIRILDIASPFYIRTVGQIDTGGETYIVREHNQTVYAANNPAGLLVYDVSSPSQAIKQQALSVTVNDMHVSNNNLLVASKDKGLLAFPIKDNGTLDQHYSVIQDAADKVIASQSTIVSATNNTLTLWTNKSDSFRLVATIKLDEVITDMQLQEAQLLVATPGKGLLGYDISNLEKPVLRSRYPATDVIGPFITHGKAVFFGGSHTIASVQRSTILQWRSVNDHEIEINIPDDLPVGTYHLEIFQSEYLTERWPNAITVNFPHRKKPKLTMEDFKKLLEKHRSQQADK